MLTGYPATDTPVAMTTGYALAIEPRRIMANAPSCRKTASGVSGPSPIADLAAAFCKALVRQGKTPGATIRHVGFLTCRKVQSCHPARPLFFATNSPRHLPVRSGVGGVVYLPDTPPMPLLEAPA